MKKLLGIVVLGLLLSGNVYSENLFDDLEKDIIKETSICNYQAVLSKKKPCNELEFLKKMYHNPYLKYIPRPNNVSVDEFRNLINQRINNHPKYIKVRKENEKRAKEQADFECYIIGGKANNWLSARKIYKSCMKAAGY